MAVLDEIAARKHLLVARSDAARFEIARRFYRYQARTAFARQVGNIFRNPLVLAGLGLLALKLPWRKTYRLGGWAWRAWGIIRTVRKFVV